ncbi:MAG: zf-HC2 domain-containing protein [Ruminococcus sp.]|nr:zf-HC2 domain-containing protein [Ruminococcus sp.]
MDKKYDCQLIQDLLPLYKDEACSDFSRTVVEEHLGECTECRQIMTDLKNDKLESQLAQEKNSILKKHFKKERKMTFLIGTVTAGILMIPVIVCLICNLAGGHGLDWFFIVLTALLVTASLSVVPLMVPEHTVLWTLGSFTLSLLLLLLTICLYTGGNWFFLASVPTLFGLSVVFMPYVVRQFPLPGALSRNKALLVMLWDTLWLYGVIIVCGFYSTHPDYWRVALSITSVCLLLPWTLFLIIRYARLHVLIKAGICTLLAGLFSCLINPVIALILHQPRHIISYANFMIWNDAAIQAVSILAIALVTIPTGLFLIMSGCIKAHKDKIDKNKQ